MLEVPLKPNLGRGFLGVLCFDEFACCFLCAVCVLVLEVWGGDEKNKSLEQRLSLSRSWHKGHSHAYNTPFSI